MAAMQRARGAPNFFIAFPITNSEIISNVSQVQKWATEQSLAPPWNGLRSTHIFKDAMTPVSQLHLTVHKMHFRDDRDVQMAQVVFAEVGSMLQQEFKDNPMHLTFQGLEDFANSVAHAKIKEQSQMDRLTSLHELFQRKFQEYLDIPLNERWYCPQVTIAKTARDRQLLRKRLKHFPPTMWSRFQSTSFGTEHVTKMQLLQRGGGDNGEYYRCYGEYRLDCSSSDNKTVAVFK